MKEGLINLFFLLFASLWAVRSSFQLKFNKLNAFHSKISMVGEANLDWPNLGFQYRDTNCFVYSTFSDGKWSKLSTSSSPYIPVHIGATALHYGQACFEGLKAFHSKDGKVRLFRPIENAMRIKHSAQRICMPEVGEDLFLEAAKKVVSLNEKYIPPYGTGGALYLRPLLFGSGPRIGLQPSETYTFLIMAIPVADYYKGGLHPVDSIVVSEYDRAAPRGVGNAKVAGNYAADLLPNTLSKKAGYPISLYLDAKVISRSALKSFVIVLL
jgi:branched-chain amino acid aminotransferase